MVAQYFERRRAVALGLATSCTGLGGLVLAISLNYLFDTYGYSGTILIYCKFKAATIIILCCTLCAPYSTHFSWSDAALLRTWSHLPTSPLKILEGRHQ